MVHGQSFYNLDVGKMNTTLDYLFRIKAPWISVVLGEPERIKWIPSHFYSRPGFNVCVRRLRGKKMRTKTTLMDEFGASLQFFEGFGENWHALRECLEYLDEWIPADAYVLVIEGSEDLLRDEKQDQMEAFLRTLHDVGEWWAKPITDNDRFNRKGIPFHILLNVGESEPLAIERIVRIASKTGVPVRK